VTGAFGFIGRYITAQLINSGRRVKTITTHVDKPNPFGGQVEAFFYNFAHPDLLEETLRGVETLYNTYWVRFNRGTTTFARAVENTKILFRCAAAAGVKRIVHISVTHASEDSPFPYYRGKALQEDALKKVGIPYSIIRPTLVFGKKDILVNNIAWLIRKFPVFPIFGDGGYTIQPIFVGDLASIAITCGAKHGNETVDAIGPETYSFEELVRLISQAVSRNIAFIKTPPLVGISLGKLIGLAVRDVILKKDELYGLMANMLTSDQEPNAGTKFSDWLNDNGNNIGTSYASELDRHFRWRPLNSPTQQ
ncbi:MAG: NAD(P)H-binding protein, partial [Pseudomonadota bacterium]